MPSTGSPSAVSTASQLKSSAVARNGTLFVAEINSVAAFRSNQRVLEHKRNFVPSALAAFEGVVAFRGEDQKVRSNSWDGKTLTETAVLEGNKGVISALAFSPDGKLLASEDSSGKMDLYSVKEQKYLADDYFALVFPYRAYQLYAWTSDSWHCVSASLGTHAPIWTVARPMKNIGIKNATPGGANAVHWLRKEGFANLAMT
ncbi:hypothetical protein C0993_003795, partial [Termitomyces sp. T159_Od127]